MLLFRIIILLLIIISLYYYCVFLLFFVIIIYCLKCNIIIIMADDYMITLLLFLDSFSTTSSLLLLLSFFFFSFWHSLLLYCNRLQYIIFPNKSQSWYSVCSLGLNAPSQQHQRNWIWLAILAPLYHNHSSNNTAVWCY